MLGNFSCFLLSADLYSKSIFSKTLRNTYCESKSVKQFWILIRNNFHPCLTWVKTVCKAYKQMTEVITSGLRVKAFMKCVKDHINANIVAHLLITSKSADSFYWKWAGTLWYFDKCRLRWACTASPLKLRDSKWCSVSSLGSCNIQATSKCSDQTSRKRRLVRAFADLVAPTTLLEISCCGSFMHALR